MHRVQADVVVDILICSSRVMAEAEALGKEMEACHDRGRRRMTVESDAQIKFSISVATSDSM